MYVYVFTFSARSKSMVMGELSRSSSRPSSPSLQDRALKAGWLKKQRSIMKNWQLRWFVLRTDQLYFYKDEEETKPQVQWEEDSNLRIKIKTLFIMISFIWNVRLPFNHINQNQI